MPPDISPHKEQDDKRTPKNENHSQKIVKQFTSGKNTPCENIHKPTLTDTNQQHRVVSPPKIDERCPSALLRRRRYHRGVGLSLLALGGPS